MASFVTYIIAIQYLNIHTRLSPSTLSGFLQTSSGLSECAGCAKWGPPFSIYALWGGPIFSLRAFKNL